jgi:hypothetical protein
MLGWQARVQDRTHKQANGEKIRLKEALLRCDWLVMQPAATKSSSAALAITDG